MCTIAYDNLDEKGNVHEYIIGYDSIGTFSDFLGAGFVWAIFSAFCYAMTFIQTGIGIVILFPFMNFDVFQGLTKSN